MFTENRTFWPGVLSCGNLDAKLTINEACLKISSYAPSPVQVYVKSDECYKCDFYRLGTLLQNDTKFFILNSAYAQDFLVEGIQEEGNGTCVQTKWFDDFGVYNWSIHDNLCGPIGLEEEPERFMLNIGVVAAFYLALYTLYRLFRLLENTARFRRLVYGDVPSQELDMLLGDPGSANRNLARVKRRSRVASIDVFRGFSVMLMVFVNYGGGQYSVFTHTPWNGLTLADIVFPFFLFSMGQSAVISLRSQLRATIGKRDIFMKVLRRSIILIAIGIALNSGKAGENGYVRIPGVLQRIGVTYFIVASMELFFGRQQRSEQYGPWNVCAENLESIAQWAIVACFALCHILITFLLTVPGCPTGYLGPGGWADSSSHMNCTGGAAGYIDRLIFTANHMYKRPTSAKIFHSQIAYDPEGLLGTLTSVLMAFLGGHSGRIILTYQRTSSRVWRWLLLAAVTGISAGFLCGWSKEDGLIPVNKNLWSLSYVLATSSMAFLVFTFLYWVVDHLHGSVPLVYAGMNPFVVYIGHSILHKQLPWRWNPFTSTHAELLFMDVTASFLWLLISFVLYRNNIFISL